MLVRKFVFVDVVVNGYQWATLLQEGLAPAELHHFRIDKDAVTKQCRVGRHFGSVGALIRDLKRESAVMAVVNLAADGSFDKDFLALEHETIPPCYVHRSDSQKWKRKGGAEIEAAGDIPIVMYSTGGEGHQLHSAWTEILATLEIDFQAPLNDALHDLNHYFAAIKTAAELVRSEPPAKKPAKIREILTDVIRTNEDSMSATGNPASTDNSALTRYTDAFALAYRAFTQAADALDDPDVKQLNETGIRGFTEAMDVLMARGQTDVDELLGDLSLWFSQCTLLGAKNYERPAATHSHR